MVMEKWEFMKNYRRGPEVIEMSHYRFEINGEFYEDLLVPEEDDPTKILNLCYDLVAQDPKWNNWKITSSFIDPDKGVVRLFLRKYSSYIVELDKIDPGPNE